jgi:tetratricopeptide (TPR) repeat protein
MDLDMRVELRNGSLESSNSDRTAQFKTIVQDMRTLTDEIDRRDYYNILARSDHIRNAMAIQDIVETKKMPFLVDGMPRSGWRTMSPTAINDEVTTGSTTLALDSATHMMKMASTDSLPILIRKSPLSPNNNNNNSNKTAVNATTNNNNNNRLTKNMTRTGTGKIRKRITAIEMTRIAEQEYQQELQAEQQLKLLDSKLQHVVKLIEKAKTDVNPSAAYFESGEVFYKMEVFDRASKLFEKATVISDAEKIVDTNIMPQDLAYQRKLERMSPHMIPVFLSKRNKEREKYIFEESERQRLRKRSSHCILTRIYLGLSEDINGHLAAVATTAAKSPSAQLALEIRDLWRAQSNLQQAFVCCVDEQEHNEMLAFFHRLIALFHVSACSFLVVMDIM